jgi:hypothetical protein
LGRGIGSKRRWKSSAFIAAWKAAHAACLGFFGANGFAYNLYPERMFDEKAQTTIASALLFFFALWLLTALGYGFLVAVRMAAHY